MKKPVLIISLLISTTLIKAQFGPQNDISKSTAGANDVKSFDLDGDGDLDVLSASTFDDKIAWYENLGSGIFGSQQIITTSADGAKSVYSADLDGDGDLDVLSASEVDNKIAWYENLGSGIFGSQQIITTSADGAKSVYSADMDGDGDLDVLSASFNDDKVAWYENLGLGIFGSQQIITTSADGARSVYSADLDGDGDLDVLSASEVDNKIAWYENLGSGIFGSQQIITTSADGANSVHASDLDGDGDMDVLSASIVDDKIAWYENLGLGIFGSQQIITTSAVGAISVYSADMDGDGVLDVLSASMGDDKIAWYENLGSGIFGSQQIITTSADGAKSVYSADMDGDGDMDVLSASAFDDKIAWYENLGNSTFGSQQIISTNAIGASSVHAADLDGDGDMDVLSASYDDDKIAWYENLGSGVFSSEQIIEINTANGPTSVYAADMDGDGDMDVLRSTGLGGSVRWLQNQGGGVFAFVGFGLIDIFPGLTSVFPADMDGDGDLDAVYSSESGTGSVWYNENLGGGTFNFFNGIIISSKTYGCSSVCVSDVDGDGDMDVLSASTFDDKVAWYENYFNSQYQLLGDIYYDANQNGILDTNEVGLSGIPVILSTNYAYSYTSNGNYSFSTSPGNYTVTYGIDSLWNLTTDSIAYTRTLNGANSVADSLDFGFYPDTIFTIINPNLTGAFPSCNDTINYWINIHNQGTSIPSGIIHLQLDDSISYISSIIPPDSINGQNIYWHYDNLFFFSSEMINIQVLMPPFNSMGDLLLSILTVHEQDSLGNIIYTNSDSLKQVSICAYDPNDKSVMPKGIGSEGFISPNQELEYLIRFQNTGSDTATTVMVRDQLDENLDWSTLQIMASSHAMQVWIEQDGEAVFKFENILLPDSGSDFLASQGFVKFTIQPKQGLLPGTPLFNTSHIFFDSNPAVVTNTVLNTIYDCSILPINLSTTSTCYGDYLNGTTPLEEFSNYAWSIDAFYTSSLDTLNWLADTVGTFNLTLSSSNPLCNKDSSISITILPVIPLINVNQSICQGDSILLGGFFQTNSGLYVDSLQTINGCDSVLSTTLIINPLPNVSVASFNPDTLCDNGLAVSLPVGSPSGGNYTGIGVGAGNFDPVTAGVGTHNIIYTYTDGNTCTNSDTTIIYVQSCVGIDETSNDFGILIYPNPNTGKFTIEKPNGLNKEVKVKLLDATSKLIMDKVIPIGKQKVEMDIIKYSNGIYYLQLIVDDEVFVKKILKN